MGVTLQRDLAMIMGRERVAVEGAEISLSRAKCQEYILHPENTYLLSFESQLSEYQVKALANMFGGKGRNVYVIHGSETPQIFKIGEDKPVSFPEKRKFLEQE